MALAACANAAYNALHPSASAIPEAVLVWPSSEPVSKPLLPQLAEKKTMVAQWEIVWPPDASIAAVPFFNDTIQLLLAPYEREDGSGPPGVSPAETSDHAQDQQAQNVPEKPPGVSIETAGQGGSPRDDESKSTVGDEHGQPWSHRRRRSRHRRR